VTQATCPRVPAKDERRRITQTTPETLAREAYSVLAGCGIAASRSKVSRIVRDYMRHAAGNGYPFEAYLVNALQLSAERRAALTNHPDWARVISYPDETGEDAVRNVLGGASR
jgi:hypothetical protein